MKKYAFLLVILASVLLLGGCRASDCGCPMSKGKEGQKEEKHLHAESNLISSR